MHQQERQVYVGVMRDAFPQSAHSWRRGFPLGDGTLNLGAFLGLGPMSDVIHMGALLRPTLRPKFDLDDPAPPIAG